MKFTRRIKRTRSGQFELRLSPEERDVLRGLPAQMRDALELGKDDPAVARLNPSACLDDAEIDAEFHRLMDDDLNAGRLEALAVFEKTVDAPKLDGEEALAWMRAVNDVRLLLGTRLGVGEDPSERQVAVDDPRAPGFALYDYLSLLTQELVEALDT
ncbi:MAG TPA: DUF2017 family protein [Acidimicrobiales bacterium]|nr:DUF2017 family protein [Acidimicrobiales bacterium]